MRNFITLDHIVSDAPADIFTLRTDPQPNEPQLALKVEGEYLAISASYGALEIALRPRLEEFKWALSHVQPLDGMQTTSRQIGSTHAYIALGLRSDGSLILRPTILTDATGHITFNLRLSSEARARLYAWLNVNSKS